MSCCGKKRSKQNPIGDVDKAIIAKVRKDLADLSIWENLFDKYIFEVQWNRMDTTSTLSGFNISEKNGNNGNGKKIDTRKMCLFKTEFTNKSEKPQKYTFKTERQTKSTVRVSVQKGYTLGGSLNVELGLPSTPVPGIDSLNITGGLSGTLSVTKTKEESFEENLLWSVDTNVEVQPGNRVIASLIIEEEKCTASFTIRHKLKGKDPKQKYLPVYMINKKTKEVEDSLDFYIENMADVLIDAGFENVSKLEGENGIEIITEGVCDVCYGAKQIISINEQKYFATQESVIRDDFLFKNNEPLIQPKSVLVKKDEAVVSPITMSSAGVLDAKKPLLQKQPVVSGAK